MSYPHGIKGYKVLHLDSKSVYISRDNVFYEHIFPLASIPSPTLSLSSYLYNFVFPHVIPEIPSPCFTSQTSFPSIFHLFQIFPHVLLQNHFLQNPFLQILSLLILKIPYLFFTYSKYCSSCSFKKIN